MDVVRGHKCPVCGKFEFPYHGSYEVCEECGWEDDPMQETEEMDNGGANPEGLRFYRILYKNGKHELDLKDKFKWLIENGYDKDEIIDRDFVYGSEK